MYNFSPYQAKELALAYMTGRSERLSPAEFLQALIRAEKAFDHLFKHGREQPADLAVKLF
ncbi:hypothetical protein [Sodalis praecaptivus]|uniref:hypothetical protein n=1 Tax=Sodalis praecaptivus TaxID=1239307 RepID=UPI00280B8296|nr:hypothetical protein [Sodalis praecaptivus]